MQNARGKLIQIDPREIHFQSLNMKNAKRKVDCYLSGDIYALDNLRKPEKLL